MRLYLFTLAFHAHTLALVNAVLWSWYFYVDGHARLQNRYIFCPKFSHRIPKEDGAINHLFSNGRDPSMDLSYVDEKKKLDPPH